MTVRVFLVDDHEVVRRGLRDLIETQSDMAVTGEAGGVREALARLPASHADVAVLDVRLPDGDGVELCRDLRSRQEGLAALMLTSFDDDEALMNAVMAGAAGYLLKEARGVDLIDAIKQVAAGRSLLSTAITERAFARLRNRPQTPRGAERDISNLTAQERRILDFIAEGLTNRQIAERMFLAEKTVKNYVSNLLAKLGMRGRTEAAVYATLSSGRLGGGGLMAPPGTGEVTAHDQPTAEQVRQW